MTSKQFLYFQIDTAETLHEQVATRSGSRIIFGEVSTPEELREFFDKFHSKSCPNQLYQIFGVISSGIRILCMPRLLCPFSRSRFRLRCSLVTDWEDVKIILRNFGYNIIFETDKPDYASLYFKQMSNTEVLMNKIV